MIISLILFYIIGELRAPTWVYVCTWIFDVLNICRIIGAIYKLGKEANK